MLVQENNTNIGDIIYTYHLSFSTYIIVAVHFKFYLSILLEILFR